ncbi:MAG: CoA-binding protein [Candidatus Aenigmatarchaeota archaeon]|nr:CoA-binding protein [Candidatus Aenigmarchaeota archaeon]
MSLDNFFNAQSVAIIGVSRDPNKVGHVIFRNFIDGGYRGKIFVVNPNAENILNYRSYASVLDIPEKIELAIVAVPAEIVPKVLEECGRKKIQNIIIISAGFKEVGNYKLEKKLENVIKRYKLRVIGPNALGVFDAYSRIDSLFLPRFRMSRPKEGVISFVCQSGAVGSSIVDLATAEGYGFAKFISYGNAVDVDESDLIDYLGDDENTKVICLYIEAVKDGRKFLEVCKKVSKKKPIIAIKGGVTEAGAKATLSHTGSLAGSAEIYFGVFKQSGIIRAENLEDMFNFAKILEKCIPPKGGRVQVMTNGGGYGILAVDAMAKNGVELAKLSNETKKELRKNLPKIINIENPLDLVGDATSARYKLCIDACMKDENIDILLIIVLVQTPLIATDIVDILIEANDLKKKPIVVVSAGGEYTEVMRRNLEENGIPTYTYPEDAVRAIQQLVKYYKKSRVVSVTK